jgi:hypothetical protein
MKSREVEERERVLPPGDPEDSRAPMPPDGRPPEQTESTTKHIFVVTGGEYRCSRCGAEMNDRTLDETCPKAR